MSALNVFGKFFAILLVLVLAGINVFGLWQLAQINEFMFIATALVAAIDFIAAFWFVVYLVLYDA